MRPLIKRALRGIFMNLWKLWKLWKRKNGAIWNLWKAASTRIFRCCVAFLHFLTKTHKNMVNRIRESASLAFARHSRETFGASWAPHPLRASALRGSYSTAPLCGSVPPAPHSVLRGPVFLCRWFSCLRRRMAQCTVCRKSQAQKACYFHFPFFFNTLCIIKLHTCALCIYILTEQV